MKRKISGKEAENLINEQINAHRVGISKALARFDAENTVIEWLDTFRAIEEFINLPMFGLDDDKLEHAIINFRLDPFNFDQNALEQIQNTLLRRLDEDVVKRFVLTLMQAMAIGEAFRQNGLLEAASGFKTVGHAIGYFQSRRRHLVALLYTMPEACCGTHPVERLDTLNQFLPQVEHSGLTLTGHHHQLMLAKVFPDHELIVSDHGFTSNHHFEPLDTAFLEPERASIMEMNAVLADDMKTIQLEDVDPKLIFSAAELRNNIQLMETAYAEFNLADSAFGPMAKLIRECLVACEDEYLIKLTATRLEQIIEDAGLTAAMRRQLIHHGNDYVANLDVYAPFIKLNNIYVSTVTLLSRFLYYWKNVCLNRIRRFQIRAGFIFENSVKEALSKQGFTVTNVKRINRKEFDVVTVLDKVIYNVQCKNNLVNLSKIEPDPVLFARYNRRLDRYYARALIKEEAREQLLKDELGLTEVHHFVVSRFPVATDNPRIIAYSHLHRFKAIVTNQISQD